MDFSKFTEDNGIRIRDVKLMKGPTVMCPLHEERISQSHFTCRIERQGSSLTVRGAAVLFHPESEPPTVDDVTVDDVLESYSSLILDVEGLCGDTLSMESCVENWGDEVKGREVFFRCMREANDLYHFLGNDLYVEFIEASIDALREDAAEIEKQREAGGEDA